MVTKEGQDPPILRILRIARKAIRLAKHVEAMVLRFADGPDISELGKLNRKILVETAGQFFFLDSCVSLDVSASEYNLRQRSFLRAFQAVTIERFYRKIFGVLSLTRIFFWYIKTAWRTTLSKIRAKGSRN